MGLTPFVYFPLTLAEIFYHLFNKSDLVLIKVIKVIKVKRALRLQCCEAEAGGGQEP